MIVVIGCDGDSAKSKVNRADVLYQAIGIKIPQVLVPAGEFTRGSNKEDDLDMRQRYGFPAPLYIDEHPQAKIYLDAFRIDAYEVTNKQFKSYVINARQMLPYLWMSNGYAITEEQLNILDIEELRKMATDVLC